MFFYFVPGKTSSRGPCYWQISCWGDDLAYSLYSLQRQKRMVRNIVFDQFLITYFDISDLFWYFWPILIFLILTSCSAIQLMNCSAKSQVAVEYVVLEVYSPFPFLLHNSKFCFQNLLILIFSILHLNYFWNTIS